MRVLGFVVYVAAAAANLWPILMLSMGTSFGGAKPYSFGYTAPTLCEIASIALLSFAGVALLAGKSTPKALYLLGPILSLCTATILSLTSFRGSSLLLVLPEAIISSGALMIGMDVESFLETT